MWRAARTVIAWSVVAALASCGENTPPGPGGGEEETILSSAVQADWTFDDGCFGGPLWQDGSFRIETTPLTPPACDGNPGALWVTAQTANVKQYSNVRARFSVELGLESPASGDGQAYAAVTINAHESSGAPGSSYYGYWALRDLGTQAFDEDFDISLSSADWQWLLNVVVDVQLHCYALTADGHCTDRAVAEIRDFRIVGTR